MKKKKSSIAILKSFETCQDEKENYLSPKKISENFSPLRIFYLLVFGTTNNKTNTFALLWKNKEQN